MKAVQQLTGLTYRPAYSTGELLNIPRQSVRYCTWWAVFVAFVVFAILRENGGNTVIAMKL